MLQYLDVPMYHTDMRYSVSMTGILALTESRYRQRHNTTKEILQQPRSGFITKKDYLQKFPQITTTKKRKVKQSNPSETKPVRQKRSKEYTINRTEVTHRIRQYINSMSSEKLLYFWTITLPQGTDDNTAFTLLNKWLTRLRQEKMIKEYLWITERQANGTIHFHMVINNRMDVRKANKYMRASIMRSIDSSEINWTREQAIKYNGVDIAKDRRNKRVVNFAKQKSQKALAAYLTKYITKNDGKFTHLAWHCSRGYSNLITQVRLTESELIQSNLFNQINLDEKLETTYYTFFRWKGSPPKRVTDYLRRTNQIIIKLLMG